MSVVGGLDLLDQTEAADLEAFLRRVDRLAAGTLVRLVTDPRQRVVTGHVRLPFGVPVSRTARAVLTGSSDVTVRAADLAEVLARFPDGSDRVALPARRDAEWRGQLPPVAGWRRVDSVPVGALRQVVRAGIAVFRTATAQNNGAPVRPAVADALLDHQALTVSHQQDTVTFPLRVCHAAWRMGFLGADDSAHCTVSVAGRWSRLAAPYGSVYRGPDEVSVLLVR